MIRGAEGIRDAYRDDSVARGYVGERFVEPLGAMLHRKQCQEVERSLREVRPRRVLEIAPGPARLTVEIQDSFAGEGVLVDASGEMLAEARRRLGPASRWRSIQGDVFALPLRGPFDMVYSFRLIRHFDEPERGQIYRQVARVLRPGGLLVFDAVNVKVSARLRARAPAGEFQHFDALLDPKQIESELQAAGFEVVSLKGVQHRYIWLRRLQVLVGPRSKTVARALMELLDRLGGEPLEWIVTCRRK